MNARDELSDNRTNTLQNIKMSNSDNIDNHRTSKERKIKVRDRIIERLHGNNATLPGPFIHAINNY